MNLTVRLRNGTVVEILPDGTRVTLPSGEVVPGAPHNTASYRDTAQRLGYGGDVLALCHDHDPLHCLLADWLGLPGSYSLKHAAGTLDPADRDKADAEEDAVLAVQRFIRIAGASLPFLTPVNFPR